MTDAERVPLDAPAPAESGPSLLGVPYLRRIWHRQLRKMAGEPVGFGPGESWIKDKLVIHGLGVALEEFYRFLGGRPGFPELERWILERSGAPRDPLEIRRMNTTVAGTEHDDGVKAALAELERMEPVLGPEDLAAWERDGYIILHDAITPEQTAAALEALWTFTGAGPDDPESWYRGRRDIFVPLYNHPALDAVRRSPRILKAHAQLWGTPDLWCSVDRMSLNPPERDGWRFPGPNLHWDTSLVPPVQYGMQGVLYLTDTEAEQGAFTCVPGLHHHLDDWLRALPPGADPRTQDFTSFNPQAIPGKAGDLIIWLWALAHGGRPNRTTRPRIAMFLDVYPASTLFHTVWR
jgi:hypothetical protein